MFQEMLVWVSECVCVGVLSVCVGGLYCVRVCASPMFVTVSDLKEYKEPPVGVKAQPLVL